MKNVLVVSNYNAGRKKALMLKKVIHKFLLKRATKFKFISIDELSDIEIGTFDTVFIIGGDGTVNKVVNTVLTADCKEIVLGTISCGTANLLAYNLGFSNNLNKTFEIIDKNNIKEVDVLDINGKYSVLRCGLGYDAEIICKTPQSLKNKFGYFAYFIAGIIFALRLKPKQYEISYADKNINVDATSIIIANCANMYRNIVSVANNSKPDDNLFDIFVLKTKNPFSFFLEFLRIFLGIRQNTKRALFFQTNTASIKNKWSVCHIDGEKNKLKNDINITILPQKVKFYCK